MLRCQWLGCFLICCFLFSLPAVGAAASSRELSDAILARLTKGFDELSQNNLTAAQEEFAQVIREDFDNPFANNNLAVIMEKQGRLADALAYLKVAATFADAYHQKVETLYLIGGVLAAVRPDKANAMDSEIARVIAANRRNLADKMGLPPDDSSPPAQP
uniref:tetratricopeptide repeat protein n=1 Tax=Desulfobacca sp. TaxID=2067990 RepID=UPI00404A99F5